MKLVVGLGNPGRKYQGTRHNAGFWWIERLAASCGAGLRAESRFHGRVGRLTAPAGDVWLLAPDTYMNDSGRAVQALAAFYRIDCGAILVVHDELDHPPGVARLKKGGGAGGHNGVADIALQLGSKEFWRLRLGIGRPPPQWQGADYVLSAPPAEEQRKIDSAIDQSLAAWPLIAAGAMDRAMMKLHTKEKPAAPPGDGAGDTGKASDGERDRRAD